MKQNYYLLYIISSPETEYVYLGITKRKLDKHMSQLKSTFRKWEQNSNMQYHQSYFLLPFDGCEIKLLEDTKFYDKKQAKLKLQFWLDKYNDVSINKNNAILLENRSDFKYLCECGSIIPHYTRYRHFHSKKHINFLNNEQQSCNR